MNKMAVPSIITIRGTQKLPDEPPESIELVTEGTYSYEPGLVSFSYVETQMTGLEGVVTSFLIEDGKNVTLKRTGQVNSVMRFAIGESEESLYEVTGVGALLMGVQTLDLRTLFNENGGILDLEYSIEIERTISTINAYHIEIRRK